MKGFQWCDFEFDEDMFPDARAQIRSMKQERGLMAILTPMLAFVRRVFEFDRRVDCLTSAQKKVIL